MSIIEPETSLVEESHAPPPAGPSFKARLAQRRRELEADSAFELAVPGYPDLWAQYRVLGYEEIRTIGLRVEGETDDQVSGERLSAAETLAEACVGLLEHKGVDSNGKPVFETLGYRWTAAAANDLFEIRLPDGVSDRVAILSIFPYPRDMLMMTHFQEFLEQAMGYLPQLEAVLQGESPGRSAPTTSD